MSAAAANAAARQDRQSVRLIAGGVGKHRVTVNYPKTALLPEPRHLAPRGQLHLLGWLVLEFVAVVLVALAAKMVLTPTSPRQDPPPPPGAFRATPEQLAQLRFASVQLGADAELVRANGSIAADGDHSTPILLPFSGQVLDVLVEQGARVVRGQPLLRIASPELVDARNALLTASAQRTTAAEALRMAEANLARQKAIYETAGGAMKDFLQAQLDLVTAQSNARQAESALRTAQDRLGLFGKSAAETHALESPARALDRSASTLYRAPVSGVVADRNVAPGQFLSAGGSSAVMTITDPAHVWLVAQLPESEAAGIHLGDQVVVTTPALPGRQFAATIDNIAAGLDPATHRLPVRATIANPDGALKPQMFAAFVIRRAIGGNAGVLVPAAAVIHEGDGARVWLQGKGGLLYGRNVVTGESEGGFTRVVRGLQPGDRVVSQGALFVNEAGLDQ
jgi:cobalt-zinc-cadmium efflux system membrane fusion protein